MESLDFTALLEDQLTGTLDSIIASFEALSEAAAQAAEDLSAAFSAASADADMLAGSVDTATASTDALAASMDAASASADASAASMDAASASADASAASMDANAASVDAASASHNEFAKSASSWVMPLTVATAVVLGTGAAAVKMSGDFEASMTRLVTGAGESASNLNEVSSGILEMAGQTGESTKQLALAMFMIESAGEHGAKGLDVLRDSAEASRESDAQMSDVANALTTVLANYGDKGVSAAQATNTLLAIVSNGKSTMQALASSISTVLPAAAKYGVSLTDTAAALATMTAQNGNAAASTTYLKQLLTALASPSSAAQKALTSIGLSAQQVSDDMKTSLPATLELITNHINSTFPPGSVAANEAFKTIAGGSKQMQGMLLLTGQSMGTFKQNVINVSSEVKQAGNSIAGWSRTQHDLNTKLAQTGAAFGVLMIKFGQELAPAVEQVLAVVTPLLSSLTTWISGHGPEAAAIFGTLAAVLGGALVGALIAASVAFFTLAAAALPFILIGAGIGLLIAGIVLLITHWKQLSSWLSGEWAQVSQAVGGAFSALGTAVSGVWNTIVQAFQNFIAEQVALGTQIVNGVVGMWNGVKQAFTNAKNFVVGLVTGFAHDIVAGFLWLYDHNYYFHNLVVGIQREFAWIKTTIATIWHDVTSFLSAEWALIQKIASTVFDDVKASIAFDWKLIETFIVQPVEHAVTAIQQHLTEARDWLTHLWTDIKRDVDQAWKSFLSSITGQTSKVGDSVHTSIVQPIMDALGKAFTWMQSAGGKLLDMLISGIQSRISNLRSAVGDVAKNIASFLGFHSPTDEGPGSTADRWMPAFGDMLVAGLEQQVSRVRQQALAIASAVQSGVTSANASLSGVNLGGADANTLTAPSSTALAPSFAADGLYASSAGFGGGFGGTNPALLAVLGQLAQTLARQPALGAAPVPANLGGVTQQFYGSQFNGVSDLNALYMQLNTLAGIAIENGGRGATAGLGL